MKPEDIYVDCEEDEVEDNAFQDMEDECECDEDCSCCEDPVKVDVPWSDKVRARVTKESRLEKRAIDKLKDSCKQVDDDWGLKLPNYQLLQLDVTNLNGRIYSENEVQAMIGRWYSKGALPVPVRQSTCTDLLGEGDRDCCELDKLKQIGTAYNFKVRDGWLTCTIELKTPQKFPYFTLSCLGQQETKGSLTDDTYITSVSDLELVCVCNSFTNSNVAGCEKQYREVCKELYDARIDLHKKDVQIKTLQMVIKHQKKQICSLRAGDPCSKKVLR